jgi:hypothetical protein
MIMALRLQTTLLADEGAAWSPGGEAILQAATAGKGNPIIDVVARVHDDAPWQTVVSFTPAKEPFKRIAEFPQLKIVVRENTGGATVSVWDQA